VSVLTAFRARLRGGSRAPDAPPSERDLALVCHCRRVTRGTVSEAIRRGEATSLPDIQRQTTACTRCFGCRFDLERMLREALGDGYTPTPFLTRPEVFEGEVTRGRTLPRRMYMPVFAGYRGHEVTTRMVLFNWADEADDGSSPVKVRADLLTMDGTRIEVWETTIEPRCSAILDGREIILEGALEEGVGVVKLVVDTLSLGSLRPYFHLVTPTSISTTHEKTGPHDLDRGVRPRRYNFMFPIASPTRPEEAYFFCTNTEAPPMEGQHLVWRDEDGEEESHALPRLELDQSVCAPLHEVFPAIGAGTGQGTVRLEPALHKVAGFMVRVDREAALWRVQHL